MVAHCQGRDKGCAATGSPGTVGSAERRRAVSLLQSAARRGEPPPSLGLDAHRAPPDSEVSAHSQRDGNRVRSNSRTAKPPPCGRPPPHLQPPPQLPRRRRAGSRYVPSSAAISTCPWLRAACRACGHTVAAPSRPAAWHLRWDHRPAAHVAARRIAPTANRWLDQGGRDPFGRIRQRQTFLLILSPTV